MGTRWVAWCLNHEPPIQIELFNGPAECKDIEVAAAQVQMGSELRDYQGHLHCDLVLTGISGAVVAHACPGGCGHHHDVRRLDVETLRLAHEAAKINTMSEPGHAFDEATTGWFRRNVCWPPSRLVKLFA